MYVSTALSSTNNSFLHQSCEPIRAHTHTPWEKVQRIYFLQGGMCVSSSELHSDWAPSLRASGRIWFSRSDTHEIVNKSVHLNTATLVARRCVNKGIIPISHNFEWNYCFLLWTLHIYPIRSHNFSPRESSKTQKMFTLYISTCKLNHKRSVSVLCVQYLYVCCCC